MSKHVAPTSARNVRTSIVKTIGFSYKVAWVFNATLNAYGWVKEKVPLTEIKELLASAFESAP